MDKADGALAYPLEPLTAEEIHAAGQVVRSSRSVGDEYSAIVEALKADPAYRRAPARRGISRLELVSVYAIPAR